MKKLSFLVLCVLLLTACAPVAQAPAIGEPTEKPFAGQTITVFNWGEYLDESLNKQFEEETGITVNYKTFQTNEMLYASLKSGGASYDVVVPSDYMIGRLIAEDMLEPLDFAAMPNTAYLLDNFKSPAYDTTAQYSVPYMWGTVGIIYNTKLINKPVDSWQALFDPTLKEQILMFDNSRDAIGIALKLLGYSFNTTDAAQLNEALALLKTQKPLVQAYVMDQIFDKMVGGEAAIGPYYAGDAKTMIAENPDLAFVIPKEGTNSFVDAFCIPKGSKNKEAAQAYINFMCSADAGVANCETVGYSTPLKNVLDALPEEVRNDTIAYPPQDIIEKCETFQNLTKETSDLYDKLWNELMI